MPRISLLLVLPLMLVLVACDNSDSETIVSPPNVEATPIVPSGSAVLPETSPTGGLVTPETPSVPILADTATPANSVASAPSEPAEPRKQIACGLEGPSAFPDVVIGDSWVLSGVVESEGTTPDKKSYMNGVAASASLEFSVGETGARQQWSFRDENGVELDSYGNLIEWAPHAITAGNPALTLDWNCHKDAWLTGGTPSFPYYTRDYAVDERTLDSGVEVVLFKLDTTFYSSDEDLIRNKDVVYGYDRETGRIAVMEKYEYGTLDGVTFSLSQSLELDPDLVASSVTIQPIPDVPTPTPTPAPPIPVVTPTSQTGEAITSLPSTPAPIGIPSVNPIPEIGPTIEECQKYLTLEISGGGEPQMAVVTSYHCGGGYIDATGRSPSRNPSLIIAHDITISLDFLNGQSPIAVEARMYAGIAISASFMQWPEHLPSAHQAVATFQPEPAVHFQIAPDLPSGDYSLVVRAAWEGPIEVFYALSLAVD